MAEYVINENGQRIVLTKEEFELYNSTTVVTVGVPTVDPGPDDEPINKPDGTPIDPIVNAPGNISKGSARSVGPSNQASDRASGDSATINPEKINAVEQDPTKTGIPTLGGVNVTASIDGDPPFENILDQFSTHNALWTLACLEPNQYNNPSTYRENFQSIKNVVFSSAGRYDDQRTPTQSGTPEYYINDFTLNAKAIPLGDGNTNVATFSFTVYEPYSMGLFLQTLQAAAKGAGYSNYLENVPYLLKLDFIGNVDNGDILSEITAFSRFFTIRITSANQLVDQSGSYYTVTAVPFHHMGYGDTNNLLKSDLTLLGGSVEEVLATGSESLVTYLNKIQEELVIDKQQSQPDVYEIVFPSDSTDSLGIATSSTSSFSLGATLNPLEKVESILSRANSLATGNIGGNAISSSTMNFDAEFGGNIPHAKEDQVIDEETGVVDRSKVKSDASKRQFRFAANDRITQVIQKVILLSQYAASAVEAENLDNYGMADWFRVDLQIQLLEYDIKRATRAKKYTYRILPYKVSGSILKNPSAPLPGMEQRNKIICKRYDYIYSGKNNDILNLNLEFNTMFYTATLPQAPGKTGTNNSDTQNAADTPKESADINEGNTSVIESASGAPTVGPDTATVRDSVVGQKSILSQIADVFQTRFQYASADMVNVTMEIMGDPYFLADSGINSNYFAPAGINNQITDDRALNYESGDIFVYISYRTPVEPNLSVSGDGGLYDFPNGGGVSPYSGIYRVINIENKFNDGKFTQVLQLLRELGQSNDFVGSENIIKQNVSIYGQVFSLAPDSTPASDPKANKNSDSETGPGGLDQLLDTVSGAVNTVGGLVNAGTSIVSSVRSGDFVGAFSSVGAALDVARVNPRPTAQTSTGTFSNEDSFADSVANSFVQRTTAAGSTIEQSATAQITSNSTPGGSIIRNDVSGVQRAARNQAIRDVLARGGTAQEAEAAGQVAGNTAGVIALRNTR